MGNHLQWSLCQSMSLCSLRLLPTGHRSRDTQATPNTIPCCVQFAEVMIISLSSARRSCKTDLHHCEGSQCSGCLTVSADCCCLSPLRGWGFSKRLLAEAGSGSQTKTRMTTDFTTCWTKALAFSQKSLSAPQKTPQKYQHILKGESKWLSIATPSHIYMGDIQIITHNLHLLLLQVQMILFEPSCSNIKLQQHKYSIKKNPKPTTRVLQKYSTEGMILPWGEDKRVTCDRCLSCHFI